MKKLALFLALCMLVSSIGLTAYASDIEEEIIDEVPVAEEIISGDEGVDGEEIGGEPEADEPAAGDEETGDETVGEEVGGENTGDEDAIEEEPVEEIIGESEDETPNEEDDGAPAGDIADEDYADGEDAAEEDADEEATSAARKLAAGTVLYADKELSEEIGTLCEDALVILAETEEDAAGILYADADNAVKAAWVKAEDLLDAEGADLAKDELKAVAFVEITEEPAEEETVEAELPEEEEPAEEGLENPDEALNERLVDDFVVVDGVIVEYNGIADSFTLPTVDKNGNPITRLSEAAFAKNTKIRNITIPIGIDLDDGCFRGCTALLSCSNQNNSTTIPAECFEGCTSLASVSWSLNLQDIGHDAFNGCTSLTGVPYSTNLLQIGDNAFSGCTTLTYVDFPDSLQWIGQGAFFGCTNLQEIILRDNVQIIGNHAFENCSAAVYLRLPINAAFTKVNNYCFAGCSALVDIAIPANVTEIGREAFYGCSGCHVFRLPGELVNVGNNAFDGRSGSSWIRWDNCQAPAAVYIGTNALGTGGYMLAPINSAAHNYCKTHTGVKFCSTLIRDFVERCYNFILNRASEEAGLLGWCAAICSGQNGGSALVKNFIDSTEFRNRNLNHVQTVTVLYQTMLNRAPDDAMDAWVAAMDVGMTTDRIIWGFTGAVEFVNLCATYMMNPGSIDLANYRDKNPGVTSFVARCYITCLGRQFDVGGLESWCRNVLTGKVTLENLARGFFFSKEFIDLKVSDLDYVNRLYVTLLGHEGDPAGIAAWVAALNVKNGREKVFNGFIKSEEFDLLLAAYGLKRNNDTKKK